MGMSITQQFNLEAIILDIESLPKMTLETGQVLVEIRPNTWVDYESYKPKPAEEAQEQVQE